MRPIVQRYTIGAGLMSKVAVELAAGSGMSSIVRTSTVVHWLRGLDGSYVAVVVATYGFLGSHALGQMKFNGNEDAPPEAGHAN